MDRIFGLQGGHIQPLWDEVAQLGIRIIDVRHEVAAVHMAHAHNELTGQLGVAMVTAGPGVTNTVTGVANASLARASVLVIGGCPPRPQMLLNAILTLHEQIQGSKLGVNRVAAARAAEEAALRATPTHEMSGLLAAGAGSASPNQLPIAPIGHTHDHGHSHGHTHGGAA